MKTNCYWWFLLEKNLFLQSDEVFYCESNTHCFRSLAPLDGKKKRSWPFLFFFTFSPVNQIQIARVGVHIQLRGARVARHDDRTCLTALLALTCKLTQNGEKWLFYKFTFLVFGKEVLLSNRNSFETIILQKMGSDYTLTIH